MIESHINTNGADGLKRRRGLVNQLTSLDMEKLSKVHNKKEESVQSPVDASRKEGCQTSRKLISAG